MAINNGRITGPTAKRDRDKLLFVAHQWYGGPTEDVLYTQDGVLKNRTAVIPTAEGELYVQRESGSQYATLLVSVDVNGTLQWKAVRSTANTIDTGTGKAWDPLASFYDPLAS
jgi:hypothetical protein